jgi:cholestenol delta-isomerase
MAEKITHPYHPKDLKLPHFKPNDKGVTELLSTFFGVVGVFIMMTWLISGWAARKPLSITRRLVVCWFAACGLIHTVLEGYFGYFHATLAGNMDFLGQMCKCSFSRKCYFSLFLVRKAKRRVAVVRDSYE